MDRHIYTHTCMLAWSMSPGPCLSAVRRGRRLMCVSASPCGVVIVAPCAAVCPVSCVCVPPQVSMKPLFGGLTKGPTGVFKSVLDTTRTDGKRRDEIYVDVVERLSVTFNAAGNLVSSQVDGSIQVGAGGGTRAFLLHMCVMCRQRGVFGCCMMCCLHAPISGHQRACWPNTPPLLILTVSACIVCLCGDMLHPVPAGQELPGGQPPHQDQAERRPAHYAA